MIYSYSFHLKELHTRKSSICKLAFMTLRAVSSWLALNCGIILYWKLLSSISPRRRMEKNATTMPMPHSKGKMKNKTRSEMIECQSLVSYIVDLSFCYGCSAWKNFRMVIHRKIRNSSKIISMRVYCCVCTKLFDSVRHKVRVRHTQAHAHTHIQKCAPNILVL